MDSALRASAKLKREADALLAETKLLQLLSKYGTVHATGSYSYDLLTWRDIDLCLSVKELSPALMFEMGTRIAKLPNVATMYYRNELVLKTLGNPRGMFWCTEFRYRGNMWKIDILVAPERIVSKVRAPGLRLISELTPAYREHIIGLKAELCKLPEYRRKFRSTDIYDAVVRHEVATMADWQAYWDSKKR